MSEFVYLFRAPASAVSGSPQEMQQQLAQWMSWRKSLEQRGHLKSTGLRLERAGRIVSRATPVSDGPFTESKDMVGGFLVIEATDLAHAAALAEGCPVLERGGSVEVRPVLKG